ncbi:MAG: alpha/beta fold hydrolase [Anaerolineae bacterium]|nr:alpha/beta fold hydrolase [Anaerolineae bacterium]
MSRIIHGAIFLVTLGLLFTLAPAANAARLDTRELLRSLGGVPCPNDSAFTCVTLTVPLDHFNAGDARTLDVVFAVLPASGTRKGMFVTVTGGPGTSGIYYADDYTSYFDPSLPEHFDIVFFDQRGMGLSGGLDCYMAASGYYQANWSARTPLRAEKLKTAAKTFARDCYQEMGKPEILPFLGTAQAIEDLELFRQMMGDAKFYLYGESYGTQYVQTYGQTHGAHLAGMILDGAVDLTFEGVPYYGDAAQAFNNALVDSLAGCYENPKCRADFPMRPLKGYDRLAAQLATGNAKVDFPLGDGTRVKRKFTLDDLETIGTGQMYGQSGRMLMVRALAAYARDGDLAPLTRLLYPNLGVDETTLQPGFDPSWSDAFYYAVECQDYGYFAGTKSSRADQYINAALPFELGTIRLSSVVWGDLACVYWRNSKQVSPRPGYGAFAGVPTFVLNAESDPITPIWMARAVFEHLDDGYLITQRGGPHVIFGRGNLCIDSPITQFLVNDTLPAQRETECGGKIMTKYIPLAPLDSSAFPSLLAAFQSAETEINYLPEYWYWDFETTVRVGCPISGWIEFQKDGGRTRLQLDGCAFSKGFAMTGTGAFHYNTDRFFLDVNLSGYRDCASSYARHGDSVSLQGDCGGITLDESAQVDAADSFDIPRELKRFKRPR